jgi:hypothetical protein
MLEHDPEKCERFSERIMLDLEIAVGMCVRQYQYGDDQHRQEIGFPLVRHRNTPVACGSAPTFTRCRAGAV